MEQQHELNWTKGGLVDVAELPNGDLLIVLTSIGWNSRDYIESIRDTRGINPALSELFTYDEWNGVIGHGWQFETVDEWGHMSTAPALAYDFVEVEEIDGTYLFEVPKYFWYSENYVLDDEIEKIYKKGYLIWKKFTAREE
jgi:hypothetical protein